MPTELLKKPDGSWRVDLDWAYPPFVERLFAVLHEVRKQGQDFYVTELFRKWSRSHLLYLGFLKGGPKAAPAGFSAHNYGLACDVAADVNHDVPGLQTAWQDPAYVKRFEPLRRIVPACGLSWGGEFGDAPHIGWPGYVSRKELVPLHSLWLATPGSELDKVKACWKHIELNGD